MRILITTLFVYSSTLFAYVSFTPFKGTKVAEKDCVELSILTGRDTYRTSDVCRVKLLRSETCYLIDEKTAVSVPCQFYKEAKQAPIIL